MTFQSILAQPNAIHVNFSSWPSFSQNLINSVMTTIPLEIISTVSDAENRTVQQHIDRLIIFDLHHRTDHAFQHAGCVSRCSIGRLCWCVCVRGSLKIQLHTISIRLNSMLSFRMRFCIWLTMSES